MGPTHIDKLGNFYFGALGAYKTTKINANGNLAWIDSVGTNLPFNVTGDEVRALTVDSLQNVYTTGRHYGPNYNVPNNTNCDVVSGLTVNALSTVAVLVEAFQSVIVLLSPFDVPPVIAAPA